MRRLQLTRKIREEEKEIFILTATLLWGIMIQEAIAYLYTNNAKTVLPIVEGVMDLVGVRTPKNELFTALVCWIASPRCGWRSTARAPARSCWRRR